MLAAFRDGEHGAALFRKAADRFKLRLVVAAAIEDWCRPLPVNGVLPYIAEIRPG